MATWIYRAANSHGDISQGRIEAANALDLESRVKQLGLELIEGKLASRSWGGRRKTVRRRDLIDFCFHMEQLVRAGVPILDALQDLAESAEHAGFREVITTVVESIHGGHTLSEALQEQNHVFDVVFVALVRSGEQSGKLAEVFSKLLASLRWQDELTAQIKKAMLYPSLVLIVVIAVFCFMMIYLVPQLAGFLRSMAGEMPPQTALLLAISDIMVHHWGWLLLVLVSIPISIMLLLQMGGETRRHIDRLQLQIPWVGMILKKVILARFAGLFAMLYASGISVLRALDVCADSAGNKVMQEAIQTAQQSIAEGKGITEAFTLTGVFPSLVLRMLRVGEQSGELDSALENVSYFYNREVSDSVGRLQALIEPMLTVVLGLIMGWLIFAVLGPLYDVISKVRT